MKFFLLINIKIPTISTWQIFCISNCCFEVYGQVNLLVIPCRSVNVDQFLLLVLSSVTVSCPHWNSGSRTAVVNISWSISMKVIWSGWDLNLRPMDLRIRIQYKMKRLSKRFEIIISRTANNQLDFGKSKLNQNLFITKDTLKLKLMTTA